MSAMQSSGTVGVAATAPNLVRQAIIRIRRGVASAMRAETRVFFAVALLVFTLELVLPPALLSVARKPFDYFAFNAWLAELPGYLASGAIPLRSKLEFLPNLALFWITADSPYGVDWGFAVTVSDLLRYLSLSLLFGLYFALVVWCGDRTGVLGAKISRRSGASGMLASVLGVSTGGCTVVGCGAPMMPVVGLAFAGLSSGTLAFLADLSRATTLFLFVALTCAVVYLSWRAGGAAFASGRT